MLARKTARPARDAAQPAWYSSNSALRASPMRPKIPRNIWALSGTSFFMDISSEMILNVLPLFLANVPGVGTAVIGLIEGVAESTASLLKVFAGSLSDRMGARKPLAVGGYALSALAKPLFLFAGSWGVVAGARWADRVGKGVRTAPRDALIADSISASGRGLAFGLHRAADTGGAVLGLLIAIIVVTQMQGNIAELGRDTFRTLVLVSLVPALLAVLTIAVGVRETRKKATADGPRIGFRGLGRRFAVFLGIVALFDLGRTGEYAATLRAAGAREVRRTLPTLLTFPPGRAVHATKPAP